MPQAALARVLRQDRGRLLAALMARTGDFQRAEDALQAAAESAMAHWGRAGVPGSPTGWLLRAALRKAIDGYRREATLSRHREAIALLAAEEAAAPDPDTIPDERLRLIFTCCHPALEEKTRVALTLRTLCGLSTAQVAAVFLDAEPTMGQRLARARAKIAAARIPFAVPGREDWPGRMGAVLSVVYLIFTAGYAAGPAVGHDLCDEAIYLAGLIGALAPDEPEVEGCLALLLLTHARRAARIGADGATMPPGRQDRALWDAAMAARGHAMLGAALARRRPGPFQIKAAVAACHMAEGGPDWPQIAALLGALLAHEDTPVTRLNHAVALAEVRGPQAGLTALDRLAGELQGYQPFHAARADMLARAGKHGDARAAYDTAIGMATLAADRAFLRAARNVLPPG